MTKPRVTTADRLSNIIEIVELGRKSGLLAVERGADQTYEQGEVYFFQGRAIYAQVEGLRGREALAVLGGWGRCRFSFDTGAPAPAPNLPFPPPASQQAPAAQRSASFPAASQPGYLRQPTSAPASQTWNGGGRLPEPQVPPSNGAASRPGVQAGGPTGALGSGPFSPFSPPATPSTPSSVGGGWMNSWPGASSVTPTSGQLGWPTTNTPATTGPALNGGAVSPELLERRPRRAPDVRDLIAVVSAYNLSRNHRTILLLADGEHTVLDLVRLSSKPIEEIVALLADLERRGLVYYY
jgi:hypothetical protein